MTTELEKWFQDRPKWLQDAARRILQNGILTDADFDELYAICTDEAAQKAVKFTGLPTGSLIIQDSTKPLHLEAINEVHGINALILSRPLEFGKTPLCIVYGLNGSGKSGYVRLLKHACGVRHPGEILGDVFKTAPAPQSAQLTVDDSGQVKILKWAGAPLRELRGVEIYDTACSHIYVNEEREVSYEPGILRFFTGLTDACTVLSKRIQGQIKINASKKPTFPSDLISTSGYVWYSSIAATTSEQEVSEKTAWTQQDEASLIEIRKRLGEIDPGARAVELRRKKESILSLADNLSKSYESLSDDRCAEYLKVKEDAILKQNAVEAFAKKAFKDAPLAGTGSGEWRALWEVARLYSEKKAYPDEVFPVIRPDASCLLCQRKLDPETGERLDSFEEFVKGELQGLAVEVEKLMQEMESRFLNVPSPEEINSMLDVAGCANAEVRKIIIDFGSALTIRKQTNIPAKSLDAISPLPPAGGLNHLKGFVGEMEKQALKCDEDAKGQNRPQLEEDRNELLARGWLNQQRKAIKDEVDRLQHLRLLENALRLTDTTTLSKKKSALSTDLITNAYVQRFQAELKHLRASQVSVELRKTGAEVGRIYHGIFIRNASESIKAGDILSEGEFRIVSLAAFLADTEGRGSKTPFVFDDPISSLDQDYEQVTAERLIELSSSRQVIVFTHRLSLVGLLQKYAKKEKIDPAIVCLSKSRIGDVSDAIMWSKTGPTANRFLQDRIKQLKVALTEGDEEYEKETKALCRDIRVLLEHVVEVDLLAGIIRRYEPDVQTKGKIETLAEITKDNCKFMDDMLTKYSFYEHSQPEEAPVKLPGHEEIEEDLKRIVIFIDEIKKRQKA
ncbi:MAG: hypothetical protein Q8Q08_07730 [Candidatus Omnitrophota bacterium]|nr:hypothetical protein [Candidatus Omnitrophota bacterium]